MIDDWFMFDKNLLANVESHSSHTETLILLYWLPVTTSGCQIGCQWQLLVVRDNFSPILWFFGKARLVATHLPVTFGLPSDLALLNPHIYKCHFQFSLFQASKSHWSQIILHLLILVLTQVLWDCSLFAICKQWLAWLALWLAFWHAGMQRKNCKLAFVHILGSHDFTEL